MYRHGRRNFSISGRLESESRPERPRRGLGFGKGVSKPLAPSPPLKGPGERCKLPQRGLGQSPSRNRIWCHFLVICTKFDFGCGSQRSPGPFSGGEGERGCLPPRQNPTPASAFLASILTRVVPLLQTFRRPCSTCQYYKWPIL